MFNHGGNLRVPGVSGRGLRGRGLYFLISLSSSRDAWYVMRFPANLEADYQTDLGPEKIRVLKLATVLGAVLFASFGLLDYWALPSDYQFAWGIRAFEVAVTLMLLSVAKWRPQYILPNYAFIVGMMHWIWGLGIVVMISLAKRGDLAWSSYYCGLMLVCSSLPVSYLALRATFSVGLACVSAYVLTAVCVQGMLSQEYWPLLLMNCYFLISATIVGIVVASIREQFTREVYLLRQALNRDMEMTQEAKRLSDYLAEHDTLTEMPNRIYFTRQLEELIERTKVAGTTATVLFVDLDDFKPINDEHGHQIGDMVLRVVSQRIRSAVRAVDLVARWGGDEFVVAVEFDQQHISSVERVRQKLSQVIGGTIGLDSNRVSVTASIGTAMYPFDADNAAELINVADRRMYEVKRKSKAELQSALQSALPAAIVPSPASAFGAADSMTGNFS
jgi:diguanylate cyclase (GGDEF)-like protein